jgi:hypothetical protein
MKRVIDAWILAVIVVHHCIVVQVRAGDKAQVQDNKLLQQHELR